VRRRHIRVLFFLRDTPGEDHEGHVRRTGREVHVLTVVGVHAVCGELCIRASRAERVPGRVSGHDTTRLLCGQRRHVSAGHDFQQHGSPMGQLPHSGRCIRQFFN